jgi:hypothetical protein
MNDKVTIKTVIENLEHATGYLNCLAQINYSENQKQPSQEAIMIQGFKHVVEKANKNRRDLLKMIQQIKNTYEKECVQIIDFGII